MNIIEKIGIGLFVIALSIFTAMLGLGSYELSEDKLDISNQYHKSEIIALAKEKGFLGKKYANNFDYISDFKSLLKSAQNNLNNKPIPDGVSEWDYKIGDWKIKDYSFANIKSASTGLIANNKSLFFWLTFGLGIFGGLVFMVPKFSSLPGIKNDNIYHSHMTAGLKLNWRKFFLGSTIIGSILYGFYYSNKDLFWPAVTLAIIGLIIYLVFFREGQKNLNPPKSASHNFVAWLGIITGIYFILFYILLYWRPDLISNWIIMLDPISEKLNGSNASQWFLYGFLYTVIVNVMGIRMLAKYRHNAYQRVRTLSVMFFQTAFAFLIPQILAKLNQPAVDLKNIWPLDYSFFFDYNLDNLTSSGGLGIFMLVWGIILIIIGVPLFTYFFGKRWYCSWVCGCGGLAETLGDPYRQLSDKSLRAWKFERWIIHGVLVFAVVMTFMVLYSYFTGKSNILFLSSHSIRGWYGFLIGSAFAGVVGTGFYPLMGNRTWCRFGCPLAAYLGLVQKFKSRFRITTNGGQCISCGNCSTYCEMGIDVRWYAQRGQDIVRNSCVGCGVCSAVCPRGVLRLENSSSDISQRADELRTIHISEDEIKILA